MISFEQINISYGKNKILVNSSISLEKGQFYCFVGKNGSGKTSLFTYLKIKDSKINNIRLLQQHQEIKSNYEISLRDFLVSYCKFEKIISWKKILNDYLIKFELEDKQNQLINSLSGGEKQRLFLIQILIGDSDLILLDESFSNLDIKHKIKYYKLFKEEALIRNIPIVLIEHDLRFALEFSEYIIFCLTQDKKIRSYKSGSKELRKMILQEYDVIITSENKYEIQNEDQKNLN